MPIVMILKFGLSFVGWWSVDTWYLYYFCLSKASSISDSVTTWAPL